jgi:hypothetical protein
MPDIKTFNSSDSLHILSAMYSLAMIENRSSYVSLGFKEEDEHFLDPTLFLDMTVSHEIDQSTVRFCTPKEKNIEIRMHVDKMWTQFIWTSENK